jgi:hypothetical protein
MPDAYVANPETIARLERIGLATKLRRAVAELEREGVNEVRLWSARGIALAALNDIDRELDYGRPGAGIDELLGEAHG